MSSRAVSESSQRVARATATFMVDHGITQTQVAQALGRAQGYVSEHLTGARAIELDLIDAVASLAGVSPYTLLAELADAAAP